MVDLRDILKQAAWDGMDARCVEPCWAATNTDTIRGCGCMDKAANAILTALDAAGLVVVPREPTSRMSGAYDRGYAALIAASPFAKKEVE